MQNKGSGGMNETDRGHNSLNVFIKFAGNEILVGKLILDNRQIHFRYEEAFLSLGMNISPFKLSYNKDIQTAKSAPFHGIFGVFDDSLPDGWGMLLLNRALEKKGLSLNDINTLDQLSYIGDKGKGALIYRPVSTDTAVYRDPIDIDNLKTVMEKVYYGTSTEVIEKLLDLGGPSGGARPKAHVGYNIKTNEIIHGYNNLPMGFSHWILKFPGSEDPSDIGNIEYAYSKMAKEAQIIMSDCTLLKSKKGIEVFATKRFDRRGNDRIHMHSMAGLVHDNFRLSNIDYGHIIDVAFQLEKTAEAREKVLRLAAFNVYSHNRDDHSKNFSWLMNEAGQWTLAPAYDLTYSSIGIDEHSTRVAGEGAKPGRVHLLELASMYSINKPNEIIDEVQAALAKWPHIAKKCGVRPPSIERINNKFAELKD